jgi:predicted Co/Zn/Cd cation transporter (cation efflux family)
MCVHALENLILGGKQMTTNYEAIIAVCASLQRGRSGRGSATGLTAAVDHALLLGQQECSCYVHALDNLVVGGKQMTTKHKAIIAV